jgi:hypothetical protein
MNNTVSQHIVTDWTVSRTLIGKHVLTNVNPTIEGRLLLGNARMNMPDNNT